MPFQASLLSLLLAIFTEEFAIRGTHSTLAIGGGSCSSDSFVVTGSSVLRMNFCTEKPAHRQSAKR